MFTRKLIAAISFAAAIPSAIAAPVIVTTTAKGVITNATWQRYVGIQPGDAFEVTSILRFDNEYLYPDGNTQYTGGSADITLKFDTREYHMSSTAWGATLRSFEGQAGGMDHVATAAWFPDENNENWTYEALFSINWPSGTHSATSMLTAAPGVYTYSAPFVTGFHMGESSWTTTYGSLIGELASMQTVVSSVPEPTTYAMFGAGLGLMALSRRKRRKETETSPA
jgi:hypothetical protein